MEAPDRMLTVGEVAALCRVTPKTVRRWTATGKLSCIRTPSGRALYSEAEIRAFFGIPDAAPGSLINSPRTGRGHD